MQLLEKMSYNPARLYDFDAGYIAVDGPADLTLFDPEADRLVSDHFASKAGNSPFVGETLKGKVDVYKRQPHKRLIKLDLTILSLDAQLSKQKTHGTLTMKLRDNGIVKNV